MPKNFKLPRYARWFFILFIGLFLAGCIFYLSVYAGLWGKIPDSAELKHLKQSEATEVFASGGELMGKYYIYDRQPVMYEEFPKHLIDALVATEDVRFYEHSGIDSRSLLRVFFKTILMGDNSSGGGSTITLQLAKNFFGRNDYGYFSIVVNKLRESIIAQRLEDIYTKEEILTLYLNTVPFSDNTFGIESAARKFFNTTTAKLSLQESATLVGTLKASHSYNPRLFPERSTLRRDVVLQQMKNYGFLSPQDYEMAVNDPIKLDYQFYNHNNGTAAYFRSQLQKEVKAILDTLKKDNGESYNLFNDGLQIHTTIDYKMQKMTEEAMAEHMTVLQEQFENSYGKDAPWLNQQLLKEALPQTSQYRSLAAAGWTEAQIMDSLNRKKEMELFGWGKNQLKQASIIDSVQHYMKFLNMGMLNMDPHTGAVKSWVGGINHEYFKYDHVSQSKRQVGSTFKPIVYTAAIEAGIDPCTYYSLREVTYEEGWTPSNSSEDDDPHMNYSMQTALSQSVNTIAVKVLHDAGLENVLAQAKKMNISSNLPEYPSLALGTAELSVKELAGAYTAFANKGRPVNPFFINRITDKYGKTIVEFQPETANRQAFSNTTASIMIEMMKTTVNDGTAARLRYRYGLPNDIAGKTGTTQNNKDGWFVGITPNLVSVTWVGADDHRIGFRDTRTGQGANSALPVFGLMMQKMNNDSQFDEITKARFAAPSQTVQMMLDCEPTQRDNFLERLFTNADKPKQHRSGGKKGENDEKKGLFSKIKGIFKKNK